MRTCEPRQLIQELRTELIEHPTVVKLCDVLQGLLDAQDAQEARHAQKIREMRLLHDRAVQNLEERLERQGRIIAEGLARKVDIKYEEDEPV